jgi:hypothetical protein
MNNEPIEQKSSTISTLITKLIFFPLVSFAFTLLGAIMAALALANQAEDGFKNIADFFGYILIAALVGIIASVIMVFKLTSARLRTGIVLAIAGIILEIVIIYLANVYNIW